MSLYNIKKNKDIIFEKLQVLDSYKENVAIFHLSPIMEGKGVIDFLILSIDWDILYMVCGVKNKTLTLLPERSYMVIGEYANFRSDINKIKEILDSRGYNSPLIEIYNKII